jgi:hypothetical protein
MVALSLSFLLKRRRQSASSSGGNDSAGLLFITDGLPLHVSDGATVELGGESWQATMLGECLKLSKWASTDDREDQRKRGWSNVANELAKRREEVVALSTDVARLLELCEQVKRCCWSCVRGVLLCMLVVS